MYIREFTTVSISMSLCKVFQTFCSYGISMWSRCSQPEIYVWIGHRFGRSDGGKQALGKICCDEGSPRNARLWGPMEKKPLKVYAGPRVADARYSAVSLLKSCSCVKLTFYLATRPPSLVFHPPSDAKIYLLSIVLSFLLKSIGSFFRPLTNHDRYLHFLIEGNFVVEKSKERDTSPRLKAVVSKDFPDPACM